MRSERIAQLLAYPTGVRTEPTNLFVTNGHWMIRRSDIGDVLVRELYSRVNPIPYKPSKKVCADLWYRVVVDHEIVEEVARVKMMGSPDNVLLQGQSSFDFISVNARYFDALRAIFPGTTIRAGSSNDPVTLWYDHTLKAILMPTEDL